MGMVAGGFAARLNMPARLLAPKPLHLSHAAAATVPVAFTTAELAFRLACLAARRPGADSRGQWRCRLGRRPVRPAAEGEEIFATASVAKQAYVRSLGVGHVYDSRSTEFAGDILADTGRAGVDVVLNSLTGEGSSRQRCRHLVRGGRFVEIAKRDIWPVERMAAGPPRRGLPRAGGRSPGGGVPRRCLRRAGGADGAFDAGRVAAPAADGVPRA